MGIIDNFEAMLARGQDSALLRYGLGNEYLKQEDHEQAIVHLAEAVRLDPRYSAGWKLYGNALTAAGRYTEAIAAYDRGIAAAEEKGDVQAAKEMRVFRKRAEKAATGSLGSPGSPRR
jgi:tetratricopeptide (TPR) repeat protein